MGGRPENSWRLLLNANRAAASSVIELNLRKFDFVDGALSSRIDDVDQLSPAHTASRSSCTSLTTRLVRDTHHVHVRADGDRRGGAALPALREVGTAVARYSDQ